jgi:bacterioferritin-associated ferredoxin
MFVCICRAVTEQEVKAAIEEGATSVQAVTRSCCAGDDCGACRGAIEDMIEDRWGGCSRHLTVLSEAGEGPRRRERAA